MQLSRCCLTARRGLPNFRDTVEAQWGRPLLPAGHEARTRHKTDHLGITQQKGTGLYAVACAALGRPSSATLRTLSGLGT